MCELPDGQVFEHDWGERVHILWSREGIKCGWRQRRDRVCGYHLCARSVLNRQFVYELSGWEVLGCDRCKYCERLYELTGCELLGIDWCEQ